jgi:endonuclease/exonuclease/phosphatase family metal-dependent hydrolase
VLRRLAILVAALALYACASPVDDAAPPVDVANVGQRPSAVRVGPLGRRVCSWNIRRLGHNFDNRAKDIAATAKIIEDFCDVVALQEIMQLKGGLTPGYDALVAQLGDAWKGVRTEEPRPNTSSPNAERYGFLYRTTAAHPCDGWSGTRYLPDAEDAFLREPAWTCLRLDAYDHDVLVMSYHAIYGTVTERRREVGFLDDDLNHDGKSDDVFEAVHASRADASVLLLGDFNLTNREMANALPRYKDLTAGNGSTLNSTDAITDNQFDHAVLAPGDPLLGHFQPAEVLDVRDRAPEGNTFFRSVSDHLPIRLVLDDNTVAATN